MKTANVNDLKVGTNFTHKGRRFEVTEQYPQRTYAKCISEECKYAYIFFCDLVEVEDKDYPQEPLFVWKIVKHIKRF